MKRSGTFAVVILLCALAHADTPVRPADEPVLPKRMTPWRVKITSLADGEFIGWPKPHLCAPDVADHVRRIVLKHPYIEVIDGQMAARIDEKKPVAAKRQMLGENAFTAYYDVTATRTIVFTIRWRDAQRKDDKSGTVPVEVSVISSDAPGSACRETWLGYGNRI